MMRGSEIQGANQGSQERALLDRVIDRDRAAMASLYELYFPRLFKFVYRIIGDYGTTEEIVNDVMLIVWQKAAGFRSDSKLSTWILGIAYRQTLKAKRKKHVYAGDEDQEFKLAVDYRGSFESNEWVARALQELSVEHRAAIELVFYLGLSYGEVAAVVGSPVNTVKTRIFHARKRLKILLNELR